MRIEIGVVGTPRPKGSRKSFAIRRKDGSFVTRPNGSPVIASVEDNPNTKEWAASVSLAAQEAMRGLPMFVGQALRVTVEYRFVRPASHFGKRGLRPGAPAHHIVKPDRDKLDRALGDALKEAQVYDDDSRISEGTSRKRYCAHGEVAGADIIVELAEAPAVRATAEQPVLALGGG